MFKCHIYRLLIKVIPLKIIQNFMIKHHIECCPHCQKYLAQPDEVQALILKPKKVVTFDELISSAINRLSKKEITSPPARDFLGKQLRWKWRWATLVAGFMLVLLLGYIIIHNLNFRGLLSKRQPQETFTLQRLVVRGKPASPLIYRPFGSQFIFIWGQINNLQENK